MLASLYRATLIILALYFLMVIVVSMSKTSYLSGRAVHLFRALFPSWRFFEDLCEVPMLFYRLSFAGEDFGDWKRGIEMPQRTFSRILVNSQGNLVLAYNTLLQQLVEDMPGIEEGKPGDFVSSVSYQLCESLVRYQIARTKNLNKSFRFQFKVCSVLQGSSEKGMEDLLISPIHEG